MFASEVLTWPGSTLYLSCHLCEWPHRSLLLLSLVLWGSKNHKLGLLGLKCDRAASRHGATVYFNGTFHTKRGRGCSEDSRVMYDCSHILLFCCALCSPSSKNTFRNKKKQTEKKKKNIHVLHIITKSRCTECMCSSMFVCVCAPMFAWICSN